MPIYNVIWKKTKRGGYVHKQNSEVEAYDIKSAMELATKLDPNPDIPYIYLDNASLLSWFDNETFENPNYIPTSNSRKETSEIKETEGEESLTEIQSEISPENVDTSPYDMTVKLLERIEENTRRTAEQSKKAADWTRFLAMPLLGGLIVGILMALKECS